MRLAEAFADSMHKRTHEGRSKSSDLYLVALSIDNLRDILRTIQNTQSFTFIMMLF